MKHEIFAITILSLGLLSAGCNNEPTASQQLEKVKTETKEAAQDMRDYTYAQKAEFSEKMKSQLAAINKELDQISTKIDKSSDAIKAEAKPKIQAVRDQADVLGKQLDEVANASESTWDSVKSGTKKAYESLKESFQQSRQWVSDKIAP